MVLETAFRGCRASHHCPRGGSSPCEGRRLLRLRSPKHRRPVWPRPPRLLAQGLVHESVFQLLRLRSAPLSLSIQMLSPAFLCRTGFSHLDTLRANPECRSILPFITPSAVQCQPPGVFPFHTPSHLSLFLLVSTCRLPSTALALCRGLTAGPPLPFLPSHLS